LEHDHDHESGDESEHDHDGQHVTSETGEPSEKKRPGIWWGE
jgi:hypothetical protein